jgi:hypothetical protein
MLSPLWGFGAGRGIGDVNRDGRLIGRGEPSDGTKAIGVLLDGLINVIALEGDNDGDVGCGIREGCGKIFAIAFVDCLAKGNSRKGDEIGIDGCVHQNESAWALGEKGAKEGRNVLFELST